VPLFDSCFWLIIHADFASISVIIPLISWYLFAELILFEHLGPSRIQVLRRAGSLLSGKSPDSSQYSINLFAQCLKPDICLPISLLWSFSCVQRWLLIVAGPVYAKDRYDIRENHWPFPRLAQLPIPSRRLQARGQVLWWLQSGLAPTDRGRPSFWAPDRGREPGTGARTRSNHRTWPLANKT